MDLERTISYVHWSFMILCCYRYTSMTNHISVEIATYD